MTEKFFISSERGNFNEIFRKDVAYGDIKSHKKQKKRTGFPLLPSPTPLALQSLYAELYIFQ